MKTVDDEDRVQHLVDQAHELWNEIERANELDAVLLNGGWDSGQDSAWAFFLKFFSTRRVVVTSLRRGLSRRLSQVDGDFAKRQASAGPVAPSASCPSQAIRPPQSR